MNMFSIKKINYSPFISIIFCALEIFILIITFIRLPFFLRIVRNNCFNAKNHTIKFKKCVHIAFFEMLKDFPFIIISFFLLLIAPWRIYNLFQILLTQQKILPNFDYLNKKINVPGKRKEILSVFWNVLCYDYLNILMGIILICSGYKIKNTLKIIKISFLKMKEDFNFSDFDERKALYQEFINIYEDLKTIFYILIIVIIGFRTKFCYKRLKIVHVYIYKFWK